MNEITQASYLEHLKHAKELAMYLPSNHPKRIKVEKSINEMINETK
jgi:hypothetical protein